MSIAQSFVHTVTVETFVGITDTGESFSAPTRVRCYVEDMTRLMVSPIGEEITAGTVGAFRTSATVYATLDKLALFPVSSQVTLPSGRVRRVVQVETFSTGGRRPGADHIEVHLT